MTSWNGNLGMELHDVNRAFFYVKYNKKALILSPHILFHLENLFAVLPVIV